MRATILAVLWFIFAVVLLPPIQDRIMDDASGWFLRLTWFLFVLVGVLMVLALNPIWTRISGPQLQRPFVGLAIIGVSGAVVTSAAWWIFIGHHITAKLSFFSTALVAREPPGTVIAGIRWRPPYAQVQLIITNDSAVDVHNIEFNIRANRPIAGFGQSSDIAGVSIEVDPAIGQFQELRFQQLRIPTDLRFVRLATKMDYVVRCKKLEAHKSLELTIASVGGFKKANGVQFTDNRFWTSISDRVSPPPPDHDYAPGKNYPTWWGYPDHPDSIYAPIAAPTKIHLFGSYVSAGDSFPVAVDVPVLNVIEAFKHLPAR
jgi:hypothetical protein